MGTVRPPPKRMMRQAEAASSSDARDEVIEELLRMRFQTCVVQGKKAINFVCQWQLVSGGREKGGLRSQDMDCQPSRFAITFGTFQCQAKTLNERKFDFFVRRAMERQVEAWRRIFRL